MDNSLQKINQSLSNTISDISESVKTTAKNTAGMFNENTKFALSILIPLLIILVYLLYKNTFNKKNLDRLAGLEHKKKINLKNLPKCQEIPEDLRYKLVDYYIASSFMTPCVDDLQYDYVSDDFIIAALQAGARYIQLPICQSEIYDESPPTIGLGEKGKLMITSLNTLDVITSLNKIITNAFIHKGSRINYPLFIHLKLFTTSSFTLNMLADQIKSTFGEMLVEPEKYRLYPIGFEKLCNLLNKVVIFCTDNYQNSKLKNIVVPTNNLFQELHYSELGKFNVGQDKFYTNDYHKLLSEYEQEEESKFLKTLYPNIDVVIEENKRIIELRENDEDNDNLQDEDETRDIGDKILYNENIINNLLNYNKLGITLVYPNEPSDVNSKNFDIEEALYYGCQFICMNYQKNDEYIDKYIDIFKENSFRLKPSGLRYTDLQIDVPDLEQTYERTINELTIKNIDRGFYSNFMNKLVAIESAGSLNNYLTVSGNNLVFTPPEGRNGKVSKNQCFLIKDTEIDVDNRSFFIESVSNKKKVVGLDPVSEQDMFKLVNKADKLTQIEKQSYYPITDMSFENTSDVNIYNSLKLVSDEKNLYLGIYNKFLRGYLKSNEPDILNNISFKFTTIKNYQFITFTTLTNSGVYGYSSGLVGLNNRGKTSKYVLILVNNSTGGILGNDLYLQNMKNNKYLELGNGRKLYEKSKSSSQLNTNNIFTLKKQSGFYNLVANNGYILNYVDDDLKFLTAEKSNSNTSMFKITIDYQII